METRTTTMEDRKRKNFEDYKPFEIIVLKNEIIPMIKTKEKEIEKWVDDLISDYQTEDKKLLELGFKTITP